MLAEHFRETYRELSPLAERVVASVQALPAAERRWAAHVNRMGAITQYLYYTALVRRFLPDREARILDWGGQYGHVTTFLRRYFVHVDCYNPVSDAQHEAVCGSPAYLTRFHDLLGVPVHARLYGPGPEAMGRIDRPSAFYDAVLSSGVFEHLHDAQGYGQTTEATALAEIRRVLKPGGLFVIWNLPRVYGSVELLNLALGRSVHTVRYSARSIRRLLEMAGFEIVALEQHEFLNLSLRHRLGRVIGHERAWRWDYAFSRVWPARLVAQHLTIVARATPDVSSS
jgi:SAM-dependent methyltransferase